MSHLIIALGMFVALVVIARGTRGATIQKDPQRNFTVAQRAEGFARAGNRCEHFNVFGRRCPSAPAHGDHHYPHSKGGSTSLSNFVALCARHNLMKSNRVPSQFATRRLERRRQSYFPPGVRTDIVWRVGARR